MVFSSARILQAGAILMAAGIAGAVGYAYLASRRPPIPHRPLRVGFEVNPPFQIRTNDGFGGIAVEIMNEAAKRAGLRLQWVETGTSSEEAFQKRLVDLWPLMTDLPDRHRFVYFSKPWVIGSHILILRPGTPAPDRDFTGRIAMFRLPLHARLAASEYPQARVVQLNDAREVLKQVCTGDVAVGFLEKRVAMTALRDKPPECASMSLHMQPLPDLSLVNSVASTFEAAGAADRLRTEIGTMFRDGTLAEILAKYSFYGLEDNWTTYELMEAAERTRWITWSLAATAAVLVLLLWRAANLRQKRLSETLLRQSEERFRNIFQQAAVGVAQISLDGNIELANDRYCEVVGHCRHELLGKGTGEITHRKDLQEEAVMLPRLLSGEIQSFTVEKRYTRDDGSVVWAEICKSLVRDAGGKPKCFITVVQDITERKRAEAALKESEERFRNMADTAPVMIWVSDASNQCRFVNKRWLDFTGRTLEQERGEGWLEMIHPEDRERVAADAMAALRERRECQTEYRLRRADGEYRYILYRGIARFSTDGSLAGYIGSSIDITDLRHDYEQHLATQKLESLGVLAAGVAHDFNNLLGAIVARAESAHGELPPGAAAMEDIDQIRVTALRAAEIVSQLMTFARQETAPLTSVDLSGLVSEMLDLLKFSIDKSAVLKTELNSGGPAIHANASEIRQLVMNLVINASEALEGKPGCITIVTTPVSFDGLPEGGVRLEVADTGCGMTEEVKARVFDPFFTTRFMGRGLGLSAVQGIVRRHGGSIEIESAPGRGTRFRVALPCTAGQATAPALVEPARLPAKAGGTILFIEDEDSLRTVVAKILRKKGFEVVEAVDGAAAIEILTSDARNITLALLDVTLPGISGGELLDELYRVRPGLKVVLTTAYSKETAMRGFGNRELWGFIRKPYRTDDLATLLRQVANGAGAADPGSPE